MAKLNHVALQVTDIDASMRFYLSKGMKLHWQPNDDSVYLSFGDGILALHRGKENVFDHFGFTYESKLEVEAEYTRAVLARQPVDLLKTRRDGSYGYYTSDPAGFQLEIMYIPERGQKNGS